MWKKKEVTAGMFFGAEHQWGMRVLEDELLEAGCDPKKAKSIVNFVMTLLIVQTRDVLADVKRLDIV